MITAITHAPDAARVQFSARRGSLINSGWMIARFAPFLWCLQLTIVPSFSADLEGLHEQTKIRITREMVGSPITGSLPPSVWAIAFSPDQQKLAIGVEFVKKKSSYAPLEDEKSYLLIFNLDRPEVLVKRFEIPRHPAMRSYPKVLWSPDGSFIATPFYGDFNHFGVMDLTTDELRVIPKKDCGVAGILAGPQVVQNCRVGGAISRIRFVDKNGTILRDWDFADYADVLDVSADTGKIALHLSKRGGGDRTQDTDSVAIFDTAYQTEIRRWSLVSGDSYFGTFLKSGTEFCALPLVMATSDRELVCWDVGPGSEVFHARFAAGFQPTIIGAGDYVGLEHYDVKHVPKMFWRLFETTFVEENHMHWIWDVQSGRKVAQWPSKSQWVLPGVDAPSVWTISAAGDRVAEGGSGVITIYGMAR